MNITSCTRRADRSTCSTWRLMQLAPSSVLVPSERGVEFVNWYVDDRRLAEGAGFEVRDRRVEVQRLRHRPPSDWRAGRAEVRGNSEQRCQRHQSAGRVR